MLLVLCVDLDDDIGRKTDCKTPIVGRDAVEQSAVDLATVDPEDSDVNVLFEGVHLRDQLREEGESVEVAAVAGVDGSDVKANRAVGEEIDRVLAELVTGEELRAIVVTDGAQDESVLPVIRSRIPVDGVRRVIVRQAQDLESIYYTMKQVLADPETRGTILVPLGILLLIYPLVVVAGQFNVGGAVVLGLISALLGLYSLFRGLGLEDTIDRSVEQVRSGLYAGRVTLVAYVVALALVIVGGVQGVQTVSVLQEMATGAVPVGAAVAGFAHGFVQWAAAAGITSSLGQITDEYLAGRFQWRYLNAPFYIAAIATVLFALSGFFLPDGPGIVSLSLTDLAVALTAGTLVGVLSTLTFAVAESRSPTAPEPA